MTVHTVDGKIDLKSLSLQGLCAFVRELGGSDHNAGVIWRQLYLADVKELSALTGITRALRAALIHRAFIHRLTPAFVLDSLDGTRKFVWSLPEGGQIESVLIPDSMPARGRPRLTLCLSSQVGCAMACRFCLTGDLGLKRNLRPSEIVGQVQQVREQLAPGQRITNLVFMGMGEPLHNLDNLIIALGTLFDDAAFNFSHRKVIVSTVGLVPQLRRLAALSPVSFAVSLNATTEEQRRQIMPITRRYSLDELMRACRELPLAHSKRITYEYVMMEGVNTSDDDLERLWRLMDGLPSKVNLIPYNENPDREIRRPSADRVREWQHYLVTRGVQTSVRHTRGTDISAACGQLGKASLGEQIPEAALG